MWTKIAMIFLSATVTNATANNNGTVVLRIFNIVIKIMNILLKAKTGFEPVF